MRINSILTVITCLILTSATSCGNKNDREEPAHDHHGHSHEGHHHDEDEDDAIKIDEHKAAKLGIASDTIVFTPYAQSIKVTGEIIAPPSSRRVISATSSGIVSLPVGISAGKRLNAGETVARINSRDIVGGNVTGDLRIKYDAAKKELDRITPLHEKGIVSTKDYNKAVTEYESAKAAIGSGNEGESITIKSPGQGTLSSLYVNNGDFVEAGQVIGVIGDNSKLTLRADLPKRYHSKASQIKTAYIIPPCGDCPGFVIEDYNGKRLDGDIGVNDGSLSFLPVYFTFNNPGSIEGSGYVDVYLKLEEKKNALVVPTQSLVEQQGQWFVYVQLDEDCYEKRPVTPGNFGGETVEIVKGLKENDVVVTQGVTFVKLAESSGVVPEGHSHSH